MRGRALTLLLACVIFAPALACTHTSTLNVPAASPERRETDRIVGVSTLAGQEIRFDGPYGAKIDSAGYVVGLVTREMRKIPVDSVSHFWLERDRMNVGGTILTVAAVVVTVIAVKAIIENAGSEPHHTTSNDSVHSCPFVYAWDGGKFVFDAEPYGGAISRGLERDDYSVLRHLRADQGEYRLLVSNEVAESQFTNVLELTTVDVPTGRVAVDEQGGLHTLASPLPPSSARDENGRDLLPWLRTTDQRILEPPPETRLDAPARQDLRLTFPKPQAATTAKLVVTGGTSDWGSAMLKDFTQLQGDRLQAWYAAIDTNPAANAALRGWLGREELFVLNVEVEEPGGWVTRGQLLGTGSLMPEERVLVLDVSRVPGRELHVRLRPPKGFWSFNAFAVDYSADAPMNVQSLPALQARDAGGHDHLAELTARDDRYWAMPTPGDQGEVTFRAPPVPPGMQRTVLLHTRGYYRMHGAGTGRPDSVTIARLMLVPDAAARFAGQQYSAWRSASIGARR